MKKSVKTVTGILGFFMLIPGLAKFTEPFKTYIYYHLTGIGFPFADQMQHVVKFSEVGIGILMLYLAFKGNKLSTSLRNKLFNFGNQTIVIMMIVAVYTHLHPNVPAEVLPMEFKPPIMPTGYILLVVYNFYLFRSNNEKQWK
ncbi:hypothetical protein [Maribacter luteus]|uniref:Uncharacterized protein n=1 Tax=Maribacter luteus TaxID=2594478 RepID=A0A6I2ML64_9FLAO|nr:hypothetical protein [Maribacter luteus]MRX62864.1 hypothetical protein [Maribacter luteus]